MKAFNSLAVMATAVSALTDPFTFEHTQHTASANGHFYTYLQAEPAANQTYAGTIVLVHGFPDLSYGWHEQIPLFTSLGYRVYAPNMLGYPQSSTPVENEPYYVENMASDLDVLIRSVIEPREQIILGGHDWGANLVWGFAVRYPDLLRAVIGLSVPHYPPDPEYVDLADQIAAGSPFFGYMLQFREPEFAERIRGPDQIRQFLRAVYGGTTPDGRYALDAVNGINFDTLWEIEESPFLSGEIEDFFVSQFSSWRWSLDGPLHYYRTARANWESAHALQEAGTSFVIEAPTFFACGKRDPLVPCEVSAGIDPFFADLEKHEMEVNHWIQLEGAEELNALLTDWLAGL